MFGGEVIVACGRELMFFMLICLLPMAYYAKQIARRLGNAEEQGKGPYLFKEPVRDG